MEDLAFTSKKENSLNIPSVSYFVKFTRTEIYTKKCIVYDISFEWCNTQLNTVGLHPVSQYLEPPGTETQELTSQELSVALICLVQHFKSIFIKTQKLDTPCTA